MSEVLLAMYEDLVWEVEELREICARKYRFRDAAMEVFVADGTNAFLSLANKKARNEVVRRILRLKPSRLVFRGLRSPKEMFKRSDVAGRWARGEMSNFEYLMELNTMAGRSYNDINQYPVFPWVLDDYTSEELDLSDPSVYRDLSKPVGALTERSLERGLERYSFADETIPRFHWGSHYSSGGIVLYYMIRLEPFTSLHVQLQGGKFDHADRMFHSVERTWRNCKESGNDPKELIPEWYYLPEMFQNRNGYDLGVGTTGEVLGDVVLPPWAKGSAHEFVRMHRKALESAHVTAHLHEWVNLVFGYQQKGPAGAAAHNIFYFLTYEGAIDLDAIEDETMRASYEAQICEFGQTPSQLLDKPHPAAGEGVVEALEELEGVKPKGRRESVLFDYPGHMKAFFVQVMDEEIVFVGLVGGGVSSVVPSRVASLLGSSDKIVTVSRSRVVALHRWLPGTANAQGAPFSFERDPGLAMAKGSSSGRRRLGVPFGSGLRISAGSFALLPDEKSVVTAGFWDGSFKVSALESGRTVQSVAVHSDVVTCLGWERGEGLLVSGSADSSLMVWEVEGGRVGERPVHVLYGHDDEVTCVAVNVDLDVIVSGSLDGTVIVHTAVGGRYIRTIRPGGPGGVAITSVAISCDGEVVVYSLADLVMYVYSLNGDLLVRKDVAERLCGVVVNGGGEYVVSGGERGVVVVRRLTDLEVVYRFPVGGCVCCLVLDRGEDHLLVGLGDGKVILFALSA